MNRLREILLEKNIQQKEVAYAIGVSRPTVSNWVKNKDNIKDENLYKLANFLGVDWREIIVSDEPEWTPSDYAEHGVAVRSQPRLSDLSETDLDILARKLETRIGSGSGNYTPAEQELVDDFRQLSTTQKSRIRAMIAGYLDARYDNE